jgi:hypothetical protein
MHRRLPALAAILLILAASSPALAWSTTSAPSGITPGNQFSDPDEKVEAMTGRSDDGSRETRSLNTRPDGSGWSFSFSGPSDAQRDDPPSSRLLPFGRPGRW